MWKIALFWTVFLIQAGLSYGQKSLINFDQELQFSKARLLGISNDGSTIVYAKDSKDGDSLVLVEGRAESFMIGGVKEGYLTQDNTRLVFKRVDSLCVMRLKTHVLDRMISGVSFYQVIEAEENEDLLIYRYKSTPDDLMITNIQTGITTTLKGVSKYWVSKRSFLILERPKSGVQPAYNELYWYSLRSGLEHMIWTGENIDGPLLDSSQFLFYVPGSKGDASNSIWLCRMGDSVAKKIIDDHNLGPNSGLQIAAIESINKFDQRIYLSLRPELQAAAPAKNMAVDVWSYKDVRLQSEQLKEIGSQSREVYFRAVCNLSDGKVIRLENEHDNLLSPIITERKCNYVLVEKYGNGDAKTEWNWNKEARISIFLVSLNDGSRRKLADDLPSALDKSFVLSDDEKYVYYYDAVKKNYYCYRISDGSRVNMTAEIKTKWTTAQHADEADSASDPFPIAGVIRNSSSILIYDRYDIFRLDAAGAHKAIRLTSGGLDKKDLVIRFHPLYPVKLVDTSAHILFDVFDEKTKNAGLAYVRFDSLKYATHIKLEPCVWQGSVPTKARDTGVYVVGRVTNREQLNWFSTTDFQHYRRISSVFPIESYNWYSTELITYKTSDGIENQGILYKPDDFDPAKKYPMLVHYYERMSNNLNHFITPELSGGAIDIPFFVSHGYLVFTPDIHYKVGWPGRSAFNAIVSGVSFLMQRSYVDGKRIGLQGISFGGFETNYVITHTTMFAAAMSSSGMTDFISAYGSIIGDGSSRQRQYEVSRDRVGATLWERPDLYIENSPVLRANKITTPLLMMANKEDGDVPVQQGIELFTALRRLGKKAWMLQYDGEGHGLDGAWAKKDLTQRMFQFFDYYLKDAPPPKWMTVGIPASLKGVDNGFELDNSGLKP